MVVVTQIGQVAGQVTATQVQHSQQHSPAAPGGNNGKFMVDIVPVGTPASWQPGQAFDNPYGAIDAPGFNNQQNIQSVVGDNYTTSQNDQRRPYITPTGTRPNKALFDSKFAGLCTTELPRLLQQLRGSSGTPSRTTTFGSPEDR